MRYLFVSGMFRSGTTLLGRVLNAHQKINVASDPYLPFFKFLRSDIAASMGQAVHPSSPLSDYYFSQDDQALFAAVQAADLNMPFQDKNHASLFAAIRSYGTPFSPLLMPHLEKTKGGTYKDMFESMMDLVADIYGGANDEYTGVKEVWADEFIPALAKTYPSQIKMIQIVRDPRAVCASKNTTEQAYPWMFMGRQWRKLAGLAAMYDVHPALKKQVLLVQYEDLVLHAEKTCREICGFLELDYDSAMVDAGGFKDGAGKKWTQNTSYDDGSKGFNSKTVSKWKNKLSAKEIAMVEFLCRGEMKLHGYEPVSTVSDAEIIAAPPVLDDARVANWIKPLYSNDIELVKCEMLKEAQRLKMLSDTKICPDKNDIEQAFLNTSLFDMMKTDEKKKHAGDAK